MTVYSRPKKLCLREKENPKLEFQKSLIHSCHEESHIERLVAIGVQYLPFSLGMRFFIFSLAELHNYLPPAVLAMYGD